jgi:hypothetical protein
MTFSFLNSLLELLNQFGLVEDNTTNSTSRESRKTGLQPSLSGPRSGGSRSRYDPCIRTTKGYNKSMAKRLNVPSTVRSAARVAVKQGAAPNVGGTMAARRTAVNAGYQAPSKRISWNYMPGDLVRFRDYTGEIRFGTVTVLQGSVVEILSPGGMARMPCQSIELVERIEENAE